MVSSKVAIIAITELSTWWGGPYSLRALSMGVGQLLVGIFIPAFFAVTSDTLSVAIGAGLGTFIGDSLLLAPLGLTTPVLQPGGGRPRENFIAFLLFGWFVKRYRSWPAFIGATVSSATLGNLIAATNLVLFLSLPTSLYLAICLLEDHLHTRDHNRRPDPDPGDPAHLRQIGDSAYNPDWRMSNPRRQTTIAVIFGVLFLALGVLFFVAAPPSTIAKWPGLTTYYTVSWYLPP